MKTNTLVLCSGGPDAVVAAAILKNQGFKISFLHYDYGQISSKKELQAVKDCAKAMGVNWMLANIQSAFESIPSALLQLGQQFYMEAMEAAELKGRSAFVPARNLILISIAAGIAESGGFSHIAIGNIADGAYPDNQPAFIRTMDLMLHYSLCSIVRAIAPVNHLTKKEVIEIGLELDVPLHLTWSCYLNGDLHCGQCASCLGRRRAYIALQQEDPTRYAQALPSSLP